jgi:predicted nuclease with TOPRIM domain
MLDCLSNVASPECTALEDWSTPATTVAMANIEDTILEHLRHVPTAVDDLRDDMREVKRRLGHLEEQYAFLSRPLNRLDKRMERVERRLELVD